MEFDPHKSQPKDDLAQIADALGTIRDSWVTIALALTDFVTEMPSAERDAIRTEVQLYLSRLQREGRKTFD